MILKQQARLSNSLTGSFKPTAHCANEHNYQDHSTPDRRTGLSQNRHNSRDQLQSKELRMKAVVVLI